MQIVDLIVCRIDNVILSRVTSSPRARFDARARTRLRHSPLLHLARKSFFIVTRRGSLTVSHHIQKAPYMN
jgi:hypothetical protein